MMTTINPPRDPNTLSNYNNFKTTHTTVNFDILFEKQQLVGNVVLKLQSITNAEATEIILDTSYLAIEKVTIGGASPKWSVAPRFEPYGSALKIQLEKGIALHQSLDVDISVKSTPQCTALQWLTPAQTSNKKHPYMFSQCQAIHARSVFPCQDTPDVKSTFEFNITSPLPVVAGGLAVKDPVSERLSDPSGIKLYRFEQKVPIPAYLFAIASGDIAMAPIGPRSVVATSPDKLEECKWELEADTEQFLQVAEEIVYSYAWGEYNVLILPPSFPYGGMENPVYTFATPSIISKDRENVDVIAHELSHSWSGNLVSPASWEHFWLNEGWTTYLERRIQAAIHGEAHRDFSGIIGWKALTDSILQFGEDHEFTKLIIDLKGKDPDDAFSSVPYDKGATFLMYIEKLIGQPKFDKFIPHYFTTFKGKSLDSYDFKSILLGFFASDPEASKKLNHDLDWESWFYKPGFPPKPDFDTSLVDVVYKLADKWEKFSDDSTPFSFKPSKSDIDGLMSQQVVVFLERILRFETPLTAEASNLMGEVYGLAKSLNIEVSNLYFRVGMAAGDRGVMQPTAELLSQIGRMKFVRPLYRGLLKMDREFAIKTFEKNKDFYHPICRGMVEKDLFGSKKDT